MARPLVSVVTPFYNTAKYLAECIESVLAQTYADYEYLLVCNKSTDGSREIAASYAAKDARIRLFDNEQFVGQVANYNGALARVSPSAKYVKIVQADDGLFPECLEKMVEVAESDPRIGIVSSFHLDGDQPVGWGVPRGTVRMPGREACRLMLLADRFVVGSPTTVMYRGDVVRGRTPFYAEGRYHEDTDAAFEILLQHDLGFVHQVLSWDRNDNISISSAVRRFNPSALDRFQQAERYGAAVLDDEEFARIRRERRDAYFGYLGRNLWRFRDREFWEYHRKGLAEVGITLRRRDLFPRGVAELAAAALNPAQSLQLALRGRR